VTSRPYVSLFVALAKAEVRYAIAGGLAVVLHGVPRMTFDLDIVVDLEDDNLLSLVAALVEQGYVPRLPVDLRLLADRDTRNDWVQNRNLIAFTLTHPNRPMEEVDVLLATGFDWSEVASSLVRLSLADTVVPVVGRELLRRMKLASGRDKDLADANLLAQGDP
jgi:hypothetical protein